LKTLIYILAFTITFWSCNIQPDKVDQKADGKQSIYASKIDLTKYYAQDDSIYITTEINWVLRYTKEEFNSIIDRHPEFFETVPKNPDQLISENDGDEFKDETGQDVYYVLYAYFLKQRNGNKAFTAQRQKLIDIYTNLNELYGFIKHGGSFFGHQIARILGNAEYSIYKLTQTNTKIYNSKDFDRQKKYYINSLRNFIKDEIKKDPSIPDDAKTTRYTEYNLIIGKIEKLITNSFYLTETQEFHKDHYMYD
jgi:hypothetical protein